MAPLVNVLVNGRAYTVACDEGEEPFAGNSANSSTEGCAN